MAEHLHDPKLRLVEVDVDTSAYSQGHIPGAIAWAWTTQLCDQVRRDILSQAEFENLMASSGISNDTTVILYGDNNNWFAAWAFWQTKIYGHRDVRMMNGGRKKWISEGREVTTDVPTYPRASYKALAADLSIRAFLPQVQEQSRNRQPLVDVRSPQEFTGEILAPPGLPETASAADTSPTRAASPGARRRTTTAPSSPTTN